MLVVVCPNCLQQLGTCGCSKGQKEAASRKARQTMLGAPIESTLATPNDTQVGGDHYKRFAIQPIDFIAKNNLPWHEGNIVKYVVRHRFKNKAEDLRKAMDYLVKLMEHEYPNEVM